MKDRKNAKAAPKTGVMEKRRHEIFMRRSYQAYQNLRARAGGGKGALPFTMEALRERIQNVLEDRPWCVYLPEEKLTVRNFSVDHATPISRGGSISEWHNLVVCSKSANLAKGEMTETEFKALVKLMRTWPHEAMQDVLGRLKAGAAIKRLRFLKG